MRFTAIILAAMAFLAQPATAASSPALSNLERQLSVVLANQSTEVGVAAVDLSTGEMVSIRGDEPFPMASTMKIAVAAIYLANIEHGRRSFDTLISGQRASQLMERMMIHSDNRATDILLDDIGGPRAVQTWIEQNQLSGMRVDRTIAQLLSAKRDLWDLRDSATPEAMVQLLQRIDRGELLRPESRSYLLGLMGRCTTGKNRIRALLPAGTPVEHKTGTLSGLIGDVGIATMPDGRRIAIAAFARGGSNRPAAIAAAARKIYDAFWDRMSWSAAAGVAGR